VNIHIWCHCFWKYSLRDSILAAIADADVPSGIEIEGARLEKAIVQLHVHVEHLEGRKSRVWLKVWGMMDEVWDGRCKP
jgi:hypothetical protein